MEKQPSEMMLSISQLKDAADASFWGYLGGVVDYADENRVEASLVIEPHHLNLIGILHGGVHAAMLDSTMGLAAMCARPSDDVVTTNLNLHYVQPVREGRIQVHAKILHKSRKMINTEGQVLNDKGELCAFGTGTFRVIERKP